MTQSVAQGKIDVLIARIATGDRTAFTALYDRTLAKQSNGVIHVVDRVILPAS